MTNNNGKDQSENIYSLWIGDIVGVGLSENDSNAILTLAAKRRPKSISLYIKEEEDEDEGSEDEEEEEETDLTNGNSTLTKESRNKSSSVVLNGDGNSETLLGRGHRRAIIEQKTRVGFK